ncbi:hypothetical protein D3C81_1931170 [compost metagenome]
MGQRVVDMGDLFGTDGDVPQQFFITLSLLPECGDTHQQSGDGRVDFMGGIFDETVECRNLIAYRFEQ